MLQKLLRAKKNCRRAEALRQWQLFLFLFILGLFFGLGFVVYLFLLLVLGVVNTHAGQLVLEGHDGMAQEHAGAGGVHDGQEVVGLLGAEAGTVATVADGFGDAVGAAVHLGHDRGQQGRALGAQLVAGGVVVLVAIDAEGLADIGLFLRDVVLYLGGLALRQEAGKNAHLYHLSIV